MKDFAKGMLFLLFIGLGMTVKAQSTVYSDWNNLPDDSNHVDVAYRVINCNGSDQIHLNVFNENNNLSSITFTLTITDTSSNQSTTQTFSNYAISFGAMHIADCGSTQYGNLKLNLPSGYDPNAIQVQISFQ